MTINRYRSAFCVYVEYVSLYIGQYVCCNVKQLLCKSVVVVGLLLFTLTESTITALLHRYVFEYTLFKSVYRLKVSIKRTALKLYSIGALTVVDT